MGMHFIETLRGAIDMFCPKCKYEYREGFQVCSDCGTLLVNELPPETQGKNKRKMLSSFNYKLVLTRSFIKKMILAVIIITLLAFCVSVGLTYYHKKTDIVLEGTIYSFSPCEKILELNTSSHFFYCDKSTKYFSESDNTKLRKINFNDLNIGQLVSIKYDGSNSRRYKVYEVIVKSN